MKKLTVTETNNLLNKLCNFINPNQLSVLRDMIRGEESEFFVEKLTKLFNLIDTMSKTYEQDGKGDEAVAYLHYFKGNMDFYITEKDMEDTQLQAYGLVNMGYGAELGYISIIDLLKNDIELDLYFEPTTIGKLKGNK